jgi:glutathione S-transferase
MKLWHCAGARSLRPLWTLEELGLEYELEVMAFPPRLLQPDYLAVNSLGTVPFFVDGSTEMTESTGICQYLVDRYENYGLGLPPDDPDYGAYLNWLHHSDATLTFPQTIVMRYYFLEQDASKQAVADDYVKWFRARLRRVNERLEQHDYLVADRFTIADIAVGYALFLGSVLHLDKYYKPATAAYLERLMARPAFQRANAIGEALVPPDVV